MASTINYF